MKCGKFTQWRIDWQGRSAPEEGQFVECVSANGKHSFARVRGVRVIRNRNPLPEGVQCRYAITVERLPGRLIGEVIAWSCQMYAKKKKSLDPSINRWSPLR